MIKNDRAYRIARATAEKFQRALGELEIATTTAEIDPGIVAAQASALRAQLDKLLTDIAEYEQLRSGVLRELVVSSLEDVPTLLIRGRIAAGLTHAQLAERLGLKAQQIQRWEDDEYQSVAFWRLIEVAEALQLNLRIEAKLPEHGPPDMSTVKRKLIAAGMDKSFLQKNLIPRNQNLSSSARSRLFASRVEAIYGCSVSEIVTANDTGLLETWATFNARFKVPAQAKEVHVSTYAQYAHFLCRAIVENTPMVYDQELPADWRSIRRWLFEGDGPSLERAISRLWDAGVTVLPLSSKGGLHAACWRIEGHSVIVLKQPSKAAARWLFDLLHELQHLLEAKDDKEFGRIEADSTSDGRRLSDDERRAHTFAANVLLNGRAENLYREILTRASGRPAWMKKAIEDVAIAEGVDIGILANHVAFAYWRDTKNSIWGVAQKFQSDSVNPFDVARSVALRRINFDAVPEPARGLLRQALEYE